MPTRPRTRAECADGPRPCPWITCRHHLYPEHAIDGPGDGSRSIASALASKSAPDILPAIDTMTETCSLDVAARGGVTLDEIAEILGLTRESIRQIEASGLYRLTLRRLPDGSLDTTPRARERLPPQRHHRKRLRILSL